MNIGEKIKMLRTSKLMTQSELAGSEITRNMLSRIENGAAQPSLDTLRYLAKKLNVSPGFLLAEGGDEHIYFKHNEMRGIKTAYLMGDFRICRDMCLTGESSDDDEVQLILAECTLEIAIEEFSKGNLRLSCEYFDKAIDACAGTIYNTDHIASIAAVYFKYMRSLSATLSSNTVDETEVSAFAALSNTFCVYAHAFLALSGEGGDIFTYPNEQSIYGLHINAIRCIKEERYDAAYESLHKILISDEIVPEPMMYFVFCDLEVACKQTGDFKGAYEYSISKMEVLQKLLS